MQMSPTIAQDPRKAPYKDFLVISDYLQKTTGDRRGEPDVVEYSRLAGGAREAREVWFHKARPMPNSISRSDGLNIILACS